MVSREKSQSWSNRALEGAWCERCGGCGRGCCSPGSKEVPWLDAGQVRPSLDSKQAFSFAPLPPFVLWDYPFLQSNSYSFSQDPVACLSSGEFQ